MAELELLSVWLQIPHSFSVLGVALKGQEDGGKSLCVKEVKKVGTVVSNWRGLVPPKGIYIKK